LFLASIRDRSLQRSDLAHIVLAKVNHQPIDCLFGGRLQEQL
jgi:hypothetical protein